MVEAVLTYCRDFIGVFVAMVLFFLPFVGIFTWHNWQAMKGKRPHFNYFMEQFFASHEADALVFCWAAAEAVVWFIIPEFLLVLLIFMKVHRKFNLVKYDILGTIVGTLIAVWVHIPQKTFLRLPYVRPQMVTQVHVWYNQHGILGLLYQPFSGVPYKVFTHVASNYHFFLPLFLVVAIAARMVRYIVAYEATKALYPWVHKYVQRHYGILFISAIAIFTMLLVHVVQIYS